MERLTHKRINGIKEGYWSPNKKEELVKRLAEYENTGLSPADVGELRRQQRRYHWIPVEERLPEEEMPVWITVKHSSWISDYGSDFIPKEEWRYHPESSGTYKGNMKRESGGMRMKKTNGYAAMGNQTKQETLELYMTQ